MSNIPLNAMRAFEAAARTGSFTAAGRELGVSSPAISQQVKHLEDLWNQALFIRQGNRLSLTDAGQAAYPQLAQAMGNLTALSDKMQSNEPRKTRLVLSAPHSVAETWLAEKRLLL
ncbi:MAG: LysR family transcriptional regulator [Pseudomonadota bacterium]